MDLKNYDASLCYKHCQIFFLSARQINMSCMYHGDFTLGIQTTVVWALFSTHCLIYSVIVFRYTVTVTVAGCWSDRSLLGHMHICRLIKRSTRLYIDLSMYWFSWPLKQPSFNYLILISAHVTPDADALIHRQETGIISAKAFDKWLLIPIMKLQPLQ